ncbi:histidine phosphatase family protein [Mycolicibacterium sp. XJ647]
MGWKHWCAALFSLLLLFGAAIPASAAELMRVTFVRHGESAGNASGLIDTSTPGPVLTPKGQQQAQAVVGVLGDNNYDAIYGSTMVRTQLTATPMSQYLRLPIQVLPGLQEIEAGIFEGTPESEAEEGYAQAMLAWTFAGQRDVRIPGSINGHEFDARVDGALRAMYDKGDRNPVVFSHGGTIMFWTMMNVSNLTLQQKIELLRTSPLDNTDYVVIEGNPEDGWILVNWNGQQFSPDLTLAGATRLHIRTLSRQLVTTARQVAEALATRDPATIATAFNRGFADAAYSLVKFQRAMAAKVSSELAEKFAPAAPASSSPVEVSTVDTATDSAAAEDTRAVPSGADVLSVNDLAAVSSDSGPQAGTAEPTEAAEATEAREVANAVDDAQTVPSETDAPDDDAPGVTANGATDLKDGNKAVPGTTQPGSTSPGTRSSDTSDEADDDVTGAPTLGDTGDDDAGSDARGDAGNTGEASVAA